MASTPKDQVLFLPDGRRLGYADYGSPEDKPVLFFHGTPGSRRQLQADMIALAARRGVRLVAPERPGYGLSDPQPGRGVLDWAKDVTVLTDALGIDRCSIIGFSAGGPYALACASRLPARIDRVVLGGGLAPLTAMGVMQDMAPQVSGLYALAQTNPENLSDALAPLARSPSELLAAMAATMPACDQQVMSARAPGYVDDFSEALRQGVEGIATDFVLATQRWEFSLADIRTEVHLWHGSEDRNTPPAMANHLASSLPNHRMFLQPGEGHLVLFTHWDEILARLTET